MNDKNLLISHYHFICQPWDNKLISRLSLRYITRLRKKIYFKTTIEEKVVLARGHYLCVKKSLKLKIAFINKSKCTKLIKASNLTIWLSGVISHTPIIYINLFFSLNGPLINFFNRLLFKCSTINIQSIMYLGWAECLG